MTTTTIPAAALSHARSEGTAGGSSLSARQTARRRERAPLPYQETTKMTATDQLETLSTPGGIEIARLGTQHGREHADTLAVEGADADTLEACSLPSNDWGTSSSEAWYFARENNDLEDTESNRAIYFAAYEAAARARCAKLAAKLAAG